MCRVFKKSSSNGKITVYLGKRDFVDHISHVDPIGNINPKIITANRQFVHILRHLKWLETEFGHLFGVCNFRWCRFN